MDLAAPPQLYPPAGRTCLICRICRLRDLHALRDLALPAQMQALRLRRKKERKSPRRPEDRNRDIPSQATSGAMHRPRTPGQRDLLQGGRAMRKQDKNKGKQKKRQAAPVQNS